MTPSPPNPVAQVRARVAATSAAGDYRRLVLDAPAIAAEAQPGQFVALAVGGPASALLLRRSFSLHRADPGSGQIEIVVADAGPGTRWIMGLQAGAQVEIAGPLGRPFPLPASRGACILIGGGYGSAPMFWLADRLRAKGFAVHLILGAASAGRLFGSDLAAAEEVTITTDDGSQGMRGRVTDPLPDLIDRLNAVDVYACGPMPMLRAVHEVAAGRGATAHVAVEEAMACGVGVCMTCVLPVVGRDGMTRMTRSCIDGPTFDGGAIRWDAIADGRVAVPADAIGVAGVRR